MGNVVTEPADRMPMGGGSRSVRPGLSHGPASTGARDYSDLVVLDSGARALRTWLPPVDRCPDLGLGARSRAQENVEIAWQCDHADRAVGAVRLRRGAILGRARAFRHRYCFRREPDEGRP